MKRVNNRVKKLFFVVLILLGMYLYDYFQSYFTDNVQKRENTTGDVLEIYYLDVGQADSTLIRYQDYNVLIDAGNVSDGPKLMDYFKRLGISKFQYVIGSHSHEDHIGGMSTILYHFSVDHFLIPEVDGKSKCYDTMFNAATQMDIDMETPEVDSEFSLGDLKFQVLWVGNDKKDLNQNSIVLKMTYFNTSYLFMGDAPSAVEKELLEKDIKCDVLKVGHHGSQYSTEAHFIHQAHPTYSIISVGKGNTYGHPKDVVLKKLDRIGSTVYRTDLNHTIHLVSDGDTLSFDFLETDTNGGSD